jgi:hypothetical protein
MTSLTFSVEDIARRVDDMKKMNGSGISFREDDAREGRTGPRVRIDGETVGVGCEKPWAHVGVPRKGYGILVDWRPIATARDKGLLMANAVLLYFFQPSRRPQMLQLHLLAR